MTGDEFRDQLTAALRRLEATDSQRVAAAAGLLARAWWLLVHRDGAPPAGG